MKKRIIPLFFAMLLLFPLVGCGKSVLSSKLHVQAYEPQLKEVPVYKEAMPLESVSLTENNVDFYTSTIEKYRIIFLEQFPNILSKTQEGNDLTDEWYETFSDVCTTFDSKCNTFLKITATPGMEDFKQLANIEVTNLYNAVEQMKATASKGIMSDLQTAREKAIEVSKSYMKPFDYIDTLYARYPFKLDVSSIRVKNSATRLFIRFKNNDSVSIKSFNFLVECRDKNSVPVLFDGAFDQMECVWDSPTIKPGKVTSSNYYWNVRRFASAYEFRVALTDYTTSDGKVIALQPEKYQWSEWTK